MDKKNNESKRDAVFVDGSGEVIPMNWRDVVVAPPENLIDRFKNGDKKDSSEEKESVFGVISSINY